MLLENSFRGKNNCLIPVKTIAGATRSTVKLLLSVSLLIISFCCMSITRNMYTFLIIICFAIICWFSPVVCKIENDYVNISEKLFFPFEQIDQLLHQQCNTSRSVCCYPNYWGIFCTK